MANRGAWSPSRVQDVADPANPNILGFGTLLISPTGVATGEALGNPSVSLADPTTLPGSASLGGWLTADRGITLGTTLLKGGTGPGAACTISASGGAGLAQSCPVFGVIRATGTLGVATVSWSIDGGQTFQPTVPTSATIDLGNGILVSMASGTYTLGTTYTATVAQWVEQLHGYVLAQPTAGLQPALVVRSDGKLEVKPDGVDDVMFGTTAGIATSWGSAPAPFSMFIAARPGALGITAGTLFSVGQSAATTKGYAIFTGNGSTWNTSGVSNFGLATSPAAAITNGARNVVEVWQDGTHSNLLTDGTTRINNVVQGMGTDNTLNQVSLFATYYAGTAAAWGDTAISELFWYTGNQHTVSGTAATSYLTARWGVAAPVSGITDASFSDASTAQIAGGFFPPSQYRIWTPDRVIAATSNNTAYFRRLRLSVTAGTSALQVYAYPQNNPSLAATFIDSLHNRNAAYIDGTYNSTLSYAGPAGLKQMATLALDGASHIIELEDYAAIVDIVAVGGTVTVIAPSAPQVRVLTYGDSIVYGFRTTGPSKPWPIVLRHSLDSTVYQVTTWGISGKQGASDCASTPLVTASVTALSALFDGTSKNILVDAFGTNDYSIGNRSAASYSAAKAAQYDALHTALPALKILVFSPIPRSGETGVNSGGSTLPDYRTALNTVVSTRTSFCTYLDGPSVIPSASLTWLDADLLHLNDFGSATVAAAIRTAVLAL